MRLSQHRHIFHASLKKEVLVIADYTTHYGVSDKELVIIKTFRLQLELSIPVIYLFLQAHYFISFKNCWLYIWILFLLPQFKTFSRSHTEVYGTRVSIQLSKRLELQPLGLFLRSFPFSPAWQGTTTEKTQFVQCLEFGLLVNLPWTSIDGLFVMSSLWAQPTNGRGSGPGGYRCLFEICHKYNPIRTAEIAAKIAVILMYSCCRHSDIAL